MSVELNENSMGDLLKEFDVKKINSGDILKGQVIDVNEKEVTVNINYAFDGVITKEELVIGDVSPLEVVKSGDTIDVYVISPNDGEGYVQLSRLRALQITEKEDLKNAFKNEEVIKVLVKEEVKGGLVAYYGSIRVFIPASLASRERIELSTLLGKEIEVKLIELDLRSRKIVASRRVLEEEDYQAKKKELWKNLNSGEKREGVVKKIIKAGAIVDIGGITGLIHINDLSWERVKRVEDVVNIGDKVTVFVGDIDAEHERVSLILKDVDKEPWKVHADNIKSGDIIEGKVVKFMSFGAFLELFPGVEGLVHINEITDENIAKPSDVLEIGQMVKVKVLDVNKENKRVSLSIKDAVERSNEYLQYNDNDDDVTLGDLFKGLFN
ncbi:30S ribosomal protein S1 [uncultured Clostridium sp.]|uniref:30S ribosomal protein S1 n=1 Tax=uncultured Clostridium sp. TaxID=59620 RepID=UPI0025E08692|nr:30S ribosomal protein S1 [uncultured Clostridium sp.]MDU4882766.1 30S ribosomal protein S1 [Clostridium celatum]MDU7075964.1 30S ribosomal protein S1 [Clostridium celatum]